jgi:hypothetical protein
MFLLIRWLRSGRGGLAARVGAVFLLLVLIALPVARVAADGWSGFGLIPVLVIAALVAWRIPAAVRRRRARPGRVAGGGFASRGCLGEPGWPAATPRSILSPCACSGRSPASGLPPGHRWNTRCG